MSEAATRLERGDGDPPVYSHSTVKRGAVPPDTHFRRRQNVAESQGLITAEARAMVGRQSPPVAGYVVSEHEIRRYCYAIDDLNPLYVDADAATAGPHRGIIAPPLFLAIPFARDTPLGHIREDGIPMPPGDAARPAISATRTMAGGTEVEFRLPVRPGDTLTQRRRVVDMYEREGRTGPMVFTVTETEYVNQRDEVVAVERTTGITR